MPIGYDLAVRPFKAVYLSTAVAIKVSRLPKSLLLAWTGPRRTILIVMVSIEDFPVRHWTILSLCLRPPGPLLGACWYPVLAWLKIMRKRNPVRRGSRAGSPRECRTRAARDGFPSAAGFTYMIRFSSVRGKAGRRATSLVRPKAATVAGIA